MGLFSPLRRNRSRRGGDSPTRVGLNETSRLLTELDGTRHSLVVDGVTRASLTFPCEGSRRYRRRAREEPPPPRSSLTAALFSHLPLPTLANRDKKGVASRDPFLDNCKFELILLIGIGHGLQWLLAQEDSRTARGWCAVEGEVEDVGHSDAPRASSWAVLPLRAFYIWSNAIAIPMFALLSGRVSRSLAASCAPEASAERRATMPANQKTVESLVVPFLTFQLLACLVEGVLAGARVRARAPPPSATFAAAAGGRRRDAGAAVRRVRAGVDERHEPLQRVQLLDPALSWYLLALASWRAVLPAAAQMQPGAALALALALGVGVGICNVGYSAGFFLKFGTMWGNFPYFLAGVFPVRRRDLLRVQGRLGHRGPPSRRRHGDRGGGGGVFLRLALGRDVLRRLAVGGVEERAVQRLPRGRADPQRDLGVAPLESIAAPLFRLGTYFGSVAVGAAFLAAVPRAEIPAATKMGARTMYGYLPRARALGGVGVRRDVREGVRRGWAERGGVHRRGGGAAHFGDGDVHDRARRVGVPVAVRARNRGVALARGDGARDAGKRHQPRLGEVRDARSSPRIIDR